VPLTTERELGEAYRSPAVAAEYVEQRFRSALYRLLHDRQVAAVQQAIAEQRPGRILEIASGPGRLTRDIRPSGSLTCVEINEGMIAEGRAACNGRVQWVRGNAFQLPFLDGEIDLVYSFRFVRHFQRADRDRLYAEIRRVLRPGGVFMMDAVNERISKPLRDASPEEYPIYDELYRPEKLRAEMSAAGLPVVRLGPVQKWFGWQNRSQVILGPRAKWLNRLVIHALERLPARDGLEWIVTCRRA
jgi:SAM-dependent methyltransferase